MTKSFVCFQVLKLVNLTTEVSIIKIKDDELVEVTEYDQEHIAFEAEGKSCQQGHLVKISGVLHFPEGPASFSGLGKVIKVIPQETEKIKITIELRSHDKEIWGRFTSLLSQRQADLDRLFNVMRDAE
jgi:hypothetical protein